MLDLLSLVFSMSLSVIILMLIRKYKHWLFFAAFIVNLGASLVASGFIFNIWITILLHLVIYVPVIIAEVDHARTTP